MTVHVVELWLPILVGTVLAWIASALIHMLLKYHNSDYRQLPNEADITSAIRNGSAGPGFYSFPFCVDMAEMKNAAVQQRFEKGPVGFLTIMPNGMPPMGKLMVQQIAYFLIGCALVAYCAGMVLAPGENYLIVFRFVLTVSFIMFGWAIIPFSIWYGHPWSTTARYLLDALIYAAVLAGTFGWLWPAA